MGDQTKPTGQSHKTMVSMPSEYCLLLLVSLCLMTLRIPTQKYNSKTDLFCIAETVFHMDENAYKPPQKYSCKATKFQHLQKLF